MTELRSRRSAVGRVLMLSVPLCLHSTLAVTGCQSEVGCVPPVFVIEIHDLAQTDPHRIEVDTNRNNLVLICEDIAEGCFVDGEPYQALLTGDSDPGVHYLMIVDNTRRGRAPEHVDVVIKNMLEDVEYINSFKPQPNTHGHGCESAVDHWQLID